MRSETFLQLYRLLETALDKKYAYRSADDRSSVVMRYLGDAESLPVRQELDLCRELRNLLSHNADADGAPVCEPSEAMVETLMRILNYVETPKQALLIATPAEKILKTQKKSLVNDLMRAMQKRGFSHVPVVENGRLTGVFSTNAVFRYVLENGRISADTRVEDFGDLVSLENAADKYLVFSGSASVPAVREAFRLNSERDRRLAAVFLTEDGTLNTPLLGMLTPWDVLGKTD